MNNKIEELRKEQQALNDKINALEQELKQTEPQSKWKPRMDELYYFAELTNPDLCDSCVWEDDEIDRHRYRLGLIRQTAEEAAEAGKRMYYREWFSRLSDVTPDMMKKESVTKYAAEWDDADEELYYFISAYPALNWVTYFTSEEKVKQAVETIGGADIFKRYVLGVE